MLSHDKLPIETTHSTVVCTLHTGSSIICTPPVLTTDIDIVILVEDLLVYHEYLLISGWVEPKDYGATNFRTYRKGRFNFIVMQERRLFKAWEFATDMAKFLNIGSKADRATFFTIVKQYFPEGY